MCEECGCSNGDSPKKLELNLSVSEENDRIAEGVSVALKRKGILCINLLGSPGSGKTAVIEGLAKHVPESEIAVIEGDLESRIDKERLEKSGVDSFQINTHSGCHLNADMVMDAVGRMGLSGKKYLIIENVGNLVCPAGVKIGQHIDIVVSSTTEGSDKPAKYVGFKEDEYAEGIRKINPGAQIVKTDSGKPETFGALARFIAHERDHLLGTAHVHPGGGKAGA
jgi:hydrogenase nickel incorporation protein HypB